MVNLSQDSIDEFRVRTALESALIQLDASWLILGDLRLDGPNQAAVADYAVLNPRHGVALIDVVQRRTGEPEQRLRKFLSERAFGTRFPGALPIVRLVVTQCDPTSLERQLRAAFGQAPPIGIADPDWVAAINALLAPAVAPTTHPGFPLFRRPPPRRRGAPDAAQQPEEPWNVAAEELPKAPSRPAPAKAPPEAPQAPAAGRVAEGAMAPPAAEGSAGWRAKPRRQPALSDEPTAGQQIQSLIALLRQNGVQRRVPSRPQNDEQAMLGDEAAASADTGAMAAPAAPPAREATDADLFGAAPPDRFPTPPAAQPYARDAAAKAAAEPEEAEDDILSSAKTSSAAAAPAADSAADAEFADTEFDVPPPVETPPEAGDAPVTEPAEEAAAPKSAARKSIWQKFISPKFTAPVPSAEPPVEPMEGEAEDYEAESRDGKDYEYDVPPAVAAAAPIPPDELIAESADFEEPLTEPDKVAPVTVSSAVPASPPAAVSPATSIPSSIIVPGRDNTETADEAETETADEMRPAAYGDLRATRADQLSAPHVPSSIVARAAFRGLSVRREDAIAPPPPKSVRWRSGIAAGVLLVAVLGGATAWFRLGAGPDWLIPTSGLVSVVSSLPTPGATPSPATPPAATPPSAAVSSAATPSSTADESKAASVAPPPPPVPSTKPTAPAAAPAATPAPAAPPPRSSTMTAVIAPPQIETPPAPASKPTEPAKRPAPRRAVPPRAVGANPPSSGRETAVAEAPARDPAVAAASRDAAAAALPPSPQGPPIDATDLPPIATPAAAPAASIANAESAAARLHAPTSLTPVWTRASTTAAPAAAAPAPAGASANGDTCHSYTATRTLLGQPRQVSGLACRDGNGQWQIISELPH
jgi:hypothetical protein